MKLVIDHRTDSFLMVKTHAIPNLGRILTRLREWNISFRRLEARVLPLTCIKQIYRDHVGKPYWSGLRDSVSGLTCGIHLVHDSRFCDPDNGDGIADIRKIIGNTDPLKAAPYSLRREFGTVLPFNAVHASDSEEAMIREMRIYFQDPWE